MAGYTLGLDLGPNSIGWALLDEENQEVVDLGVRVFPEGVDKFDTAKEVSRNEDRRNARAMRRQISRRSRRRRRLCQALAEAGLFPHDPEQQKILLEGIKHSPALDPYALRARALTEKLERHELGRVFFHLAQRRGFRSNRKKDRGDKEVKGMLAEINELQAEIEKNGSTLGKFFHGKRQELNHCRRQEGDRVRKRHTMRDMYEEEFEAICDVQCRLGHADLLTDELKYGRLGKQNYPMRPRSRPTKLSRLQAVGLHGLMFFQRKMYWPRSAVGACDLESKQPRCPRADRRAQRFRLLQEVNNLRFVDPTLPGKQEQRLDPQQRTLLLDKLGKQDRMTFDQIRKALGFLENVKFNLEKGKRSYLLGMPVDFHMAKAVGKSWHDRDEDDKNAIVALLLDNEREDELIVERLTDHFGMTRDEADAALEIDFPAGHVQLSLKAINKLLPHLERGLVYQSVSDPEQSALHAAGYLRRDELQRRLFDTLPDPRRVRDCPIGDIPNPVVKRTLVELRKVVNAIVAEHGKPAAIHVEMGRDVKTRPTDKRSEAYRKYQEQIDQMRERERRRADAADKLRENGVTLNRDNITRYLLWEDQTEHCIYSGRPISFRQLFSSEVHADHILPYARCLDSSQNNLVVCFRDANADKSNDTPYEWLAHKRPEQYEDVCQRAVKLMHDGRIPYAKYRRFLLKELKLDDFIERQLNDTRYIARVTAEYLRCLFDAPHHVLGLKGQLTHELRHLWGIENLLAELPDSPAWQERNELRPGEKNRADHRHHVIDAVIIALTDRRRLQQLSRRRLGSAAAGDGELTLPPWPRFREDLKQRLQLLYISHRAERKASGRLHEETFYGPTERPGYWVARKQVDSLSPNEIENIRDPGIRRIIEARLREHGINFGRGTKVDAKKWKEALANLKMPSGVPIKKVRVVKPELTIRPIREGTPDVAYVKPGNTHHLCIFEIEEKGKTKYEPVFVTMLEAVSRLKRLKRGEPLISRIHPERPDAKFLFSLSQGEMVLVDWNGEEKLLVFKTGASTSGQLWFAEHTDARKSDKYRKHSASANSLIGQYKARKVAVDRLGCIRWAND